MLAGVLCRMSPYEGRRGANARECLSHRATRNGCVEGCAEASSMPGGMTEGEIFQPMDRPLSLRVAPAIRGRSQSTLAYLADQPVTLRSSTPRANCGRMPHRDPRCAFRSAFRRAMNEKKPRHPRLSQSFCRRRHLLLTPSLREESAGGRGTVGRVSRARGWSQAARELPRPRG